MNNLTQIKGKDSTLTGLPQKFNLKSQDQHQLSKFEEILFSDSIYYTFSPLRHINEKFVDFITESGKNLIIDFVFAPETSNKILNELIWISKKYLAANKQLIDYDKIKNNWIWILSLSFSYISKSIPFTKEEFLNKIKNN